MKRHIVWLMACGVLAGCASEPSPIDAPPAPTANNQANEHSAESAGGAVGGSSGSSADSSADAPAAFHFKSGTLEIGDFDPFALGDDIFDPCTEISHEEFAAAGFHNVEPIPEEYAGLARGISACTFNSHPQVHSELIGNNNASFAEVSGRLEILAEYESPNLPSIFVYQPPGDSGLSCYAQLDTKRGAIVTSAGIIEKHSYSPDVCAVAVSNLENLAEAFF
ncbi:DUF3558 family protein [Corynebacterium sp. HMSC034A01]|uniref:DUF3558 family protein n=1 Tax=Corynebacterium sp. HMSC034A01 TaxID=1739295 RepID=UPI000AEE26B7|nr:DUF3558 family protein [Corynebacterium sp. HMSC034A01]